MTTTQRVPAEIGFPARNADAACPISTGGGNRRVRLVRGVGRGVSDQYGGRGGGERGVQAALSHWLRHLPLPPPGSARGEAQ